MKRKKSQENELVTVCFTLRIHIWNTSKNVLCLEFTCEAIFVNKFLISERIITSSAADCILILNRTIFSRERSTFASKNIGDSLIDVCLYPACFIQSKRIEWSMSSSFLYKGLWNPCCKHFSCSGSSKAMIAEITFNASWHHYHFNIVLILFSPTGLKENQYSPAGFGSIGWG